jgi:hypothetical protein
MPISAGMVSRLLSLVVVAGLAISAANNPPSFGFPRFGNPVEPPTPLVLALITVLSSLPVLALIWFPDFFGQMRTRRIHSPTPGWLVAAGGWMLLLGVPLLIRWLRIE